LYLTLLIMKFLESHLLCLGER